MNHHPPNTHCIWPYRSPSFPMRSPASDRSYHLREIITNSPAGSLCYYAMISNPARETMASIVISPDASRVAMRAYICNCRVWWRGGSVTTSASANRAHHSGRSMKSYWRYVTPARTATLSVTQPPS